MNLAYTVIDGKIVYADAGNVEKAMLKEINHNKTIHFSLIDPEHEYKYSLDDIVNSLCDYGTDVLLVGGSTGVTEESINRIHKIKNKKYSHIPTIIFPRSIGDLKGRANAVLYMRCSNSRKMKYLRDEAFEGAAYLLGDKNIEAIPLTYLIVEPGGMVGQIADAQLIPRNNPKIAVMYAQEAKANGSRWLYLEAGSSAKPAIHEAGGPELISAIKKYVNLPLIVGGGIRDPEAVRRVKKAGANGIVTGNIIENEDMDLMKKIIDAVHE